MFHEAYADVAGLIIKRRARYSLLKNYNNQSPTYRDESALYLILSFGGSAALSVRFEKKQFRTAPIILEGCYPLKFNISSVIKSTEIRFLIRQHDAFISTFCTLKLRIITTNKYITSTQLFHRRNWASLLLRQMPNIFDKPNINDLNKLS